MQEEDIEGPPFQTKPPWRVCAPCAMMMARRFVSQGMVRTAFICIKRSLNLCGWRLAEVIVQFAGASSPWGWGWSLGAWRILHRCSAMGGKEKLPMHDASVSWSLCALVQSAVLSVAVYMRWLVHFMLLSLCRGTACVSLYFCVA